MLLTPLAFPFLWHISHGMISLSYNTQYYSSRRIDVLNHSNLEKGDFVSWPWVPEQPDKIPSNIRIGIIVEGVMSHYIEVKGIKDSILYFGKLCYWDSNPGQTNRDIRDLAISHPESNPSNLVGP